MYRHFLLAPLLVLGATAWAAKPPASENQRADEDRRLMGDFETYGVVTYVDRDHHTLTVRKLGGEITTFDFGTMNLDQEVTVGSTVRLKHEHDTMTVRDVQTVNLMHDVGVVTSIDEERRSISIRQLGGEVVEYELGDLMIDTSRIRIGERVDITHESGAKGVLFVDLADRPLEDAPRLEPLPQPEG